MSYTAPTPINVGWNPQSWTDMDDEKKNLTDAQIIKNALIDLGDNFWTDQEPCSYSEHLHSEGTNLTEAVLYLAKEIVELRKQQSQDMRLLVHNIRQLQPFQNEK